MGYFDFDGLPVSPGYREFYKAAIRALEKDPNQDVIFAAVTDVNTAYTGFGIEQTPSASLHLWNESLVCIIVLKKITIFFSNWLIYCQIVNRFILTINYGRLRIFFNGWIDQCTRFLYGYNRLV